MACIQYGLNIINQNLIIDKAVTKKNGIYTFRGIVYCVRDGKVLAFAHGGDIVQSYGHFNAVIGHYDNSGYDPRHEKARNAVSKLK